MIAWLFGWLYYLLPAGAASYAALYIYGKYDHMAFALVTGTLAMLAGSIYWENTNICDFCPGTEN